MGMRIGEMAKECGCQVVTIRYYENEGLLSKPERSDANYRLYEKDDVARLRFILHCRRHGMKLSEIRELLAFKDEPSADCGWITALVEKHIANVEEQMADLQHLREHLEALLHSCSGHKSGGCGIVQSLSEARACPYCEDLRCRQGKALGNGVEKSRKDSK